MCERGDTMRGISMYDSSSVSTLFSSLGSSKSTDVYKRQGLSIVKAIMDSFHQKCGAVNHPDGVEFWMELETNN